MIKRTSNRLKIGFILDHQLMHYRVAFFRQLASRGYDISIFHSGEILQMEENIIQRKVSCVKFVGFDLRLLPPLRGFDIIVCMQNLRLINLWVLSLLPYKTFRLVQWGIGTSSSRGLSPKRTLASRLRNFLAQFASAQILYSPYAKHLFSTRVQSKTFIGNNTIDNPLSVDLSSKPKSSILFIGSLNKRKGLELLIRSFLRFVEECQPKRIRTLKIIGDGPIKEQLQNSISCRKYKSRVLFVGRIEDNQQKLDYFAEAVACVSPKQAGLSVLESFSYGVPFVTFKGCISGGEHLNIIDGHNGYIIDTEDQLVEIFKNLELNPALGYRLGKNSFDHYNSSRKMKDMVDSFENAFNFIIEQ